MSTRNSASSFNRDDSNRTHRSSNPNRHPSHLRGKAIGLWYAERKRDSNPTETSSHSHRQRTQPIATIELTPNEIQRVTRTHQLFRHQATTMNNFPRSLSNMDDDNRENDALIDDVEHTIQFEKLHSSFQYFESLDRQPCIDERLFEDLRKKQCSSLYEKLNHHRVHLPITKFRQQILDILEQNQIFVLVGETGSGK